MTTSLIAGREFHLLGTTEIYKLEIYVPYPLNDEFTNWRCEIVITGRGVPEGLDRISSGGVDSYQALSLALQLAKGMVEARNKNYLDSKLRLGSDNSEDLGFE